MLKCAAVVIEYVNSEYSLEESNIKLENLITQNRSSDPNPVDLTFLFPDINNFHHFLIHFNSVMLAGWKRGGGCHLLAEPILKVSHFLI